MYPKTNSSFGKKDISGKFVVVLTFQIFMLTSYLLAFPWGQGPCHSIMQMYMYLITHHHHLVNTEKQLLNDIKCPKNWDSTLFLEGRESSPIKMTGVLDTPFKGAKFVNWYSTTYFFRVAKHK